MCQNLTNFPGTIGLTTSSGIIELKTGFQSYPIENSDVGSDIGNDIGKGIGNVIVSNIVNVVGNGIGNVIVSDIVNVVVEKFDFFHQNMWDSK